MNARPSWVHGAVHSRRKSGFPLTVKLIDSTEGSLSVQVHPDKTEAWVALGAEPEASILAGLDPDALDLERARSLTIAEDHRGAQAPRAAALRGDSPARGDRSRLWDRASASGKWLTVAM